MAEQSGYWSERALGMVHVETRGSCVDLGRAWVSSAKGMVIFSSHGVILTVKKKKTALPFTFDAQVSQVNFCLFQITGERISLISPKRRGAGINL